MTKYKDKIHYIVYDKDDLEVTPIEDYSACDFSDETKVHWVDVEVTENHYDLISEACEKFDVHPLIVEDILDDEETAKFAAYENYLYLMLEDVGYEGDELKATQYHFLVFKNGILSFRDSKHSIEKAALKQLTEGSVPRSGGAGMLLYVLSDIIIDNYYRIVTDMSTELDQLEDKVLLAPTDDVVQKIYQSKKDVLFLQRLIWPARNALGSLSNVKHKYLDEDTMYYLRDVYDHTEQLVEMTSVHREACTTLFDTYMSNTSNKTNDIMKFLTIFTTIFTIPTFLAGVFGMNFTNFPELNNPHGYLLFWVVVVISIVAMMAYFKWKKWI